MLELYRAALRIRREHPALGDGPMSWHPAADGGARCSRGSRASPAS